MLDRVQVTKEVEEMCCLKRGVKGEPAPIPQEGEWTKVMPCFLNSSSASSGV